MPSDISTLTPRTPDHVRRQFRWWWLAVALAAAVVVAIVPRVIANPPTVGRLTLANPTAYAMDVDVSSGKRDGWVGLGTAERQESTVMRGVIDQGDTWVFRFTSQGFDAGELRLSKEELRRSRWRIVIPHSMSDRLARQGATPTPPPDN